MQRFQGDEEDEDLTELVEEDEDGEETVDPEDENEEDEVV